MKNIECIQLDFAENRWWERKEQLFSFLKYISRRLNINEYVCVRNLFLFLFEQHLFLFYSIKGERYLMDFSSSLDASFIKKNEIIQT